MVDMIHMEIENPKHHIELLGLELRKGDMLHQKVKILKEHNDIQKLIQIMTWKEAKKGHKKNLVLSEK